MRDSFRLRTTQRKYWSGILATVLVFGSALGYVGTNHAKSMPRLAVSTHATEQRFTGIEHRITDLDVRLTVVERKDVKQPVIHKKDQ